MSSRLTFVTRVSAVEQPPLSAPVRDSSQQQSGNFRQERRTTNRAHRKEQSIERFASVVPTRSPPHKKSTAVPAARRGKRLRRIDPSSCCILARLRSVLVIFQARAKGASEADRNSSSSERNPHGESNDTGQCLYGVAGGERDSRMGVASRLREALFFCCLVVRAVEKIQNTKYESAKAPPTFRSRARGTEAFDDKIRALIYRVAFARPTEVVPIRPLNAEACSAAAVRLTGTLVGDTPTSLALSAALER